VADEQQTTIGMKATWRQGNRAKEVPDSIVAPKVGDGFFSTEKRPLRFYNFVGRCENALTRLPCTRR